MGMVSSVRFPPFPATQSQAVDVKATNGGKARFGRKAVLGLCLNDVRFPVRFRSDIQYPLMTEETKTA